MGERQGIFNVIVHAAEEGGYWAEAHELPGCVSQGESQTAALENLSAAIVAVIQSYVDDGEPLPLHRSSSVTTLEISVPA